jgi:proline dehydrogenase
MQKQGIRFDDTETAFAINNDRELRKSYLIFSAMKHPWMVKVGVALTRFSLAIGLPIKGLIRNTVYEQFCGGESIEGCQETLKKLSGFNVKTILDYSVEGETIEIGFDRTKDEIVRICQSAKGSPDVPFCVVKLTGIGSTEVMKKAQEGKDLTEQEQLKLEMLQERAHEIAQAAKENGLMFMIDAEESWIQDVIDEVALSLMREFNKEYVHVYNTFQMYRHEMIGNLDAAIKLAKKEGFHLGAKLVRGAYMEKERERAEEKGYKSPIHVTKEATDHDFNHALRLCMENIDRVGVCAGTHNEKSCDLLAKLLEEKGIERNDTRVFFAQLLGMSDNISFNLSQEGYNVAKYVPYGPIEKVLPYLFRRAAENTAIAGQSGRELTMIKKEIKRRKAA